MKIEFYHIDAFEVPNYEPVWRKLREKGVEANMVGVPPGRNTATGNWFDFEIFKSYCNNQKIEFKTEIDPNADIAVTTQNADILREYQCPRVRIMYGPTVYPSAWGLQPHSVKPFDAVLTHSQFYSDLFSIWLQQEQLPVIGYPRYDDFFSGKLSREKIHEKWKIKDKKPILVFIPTWGENSAFEKYFPSLVRLSRKFNIMLKPHHCTIRMEPNRMLLMQASGLGILDNAFDLAEVYAGADIVLTDARSGSLFEASICNVPSVSMIVDPAEISGWITQNGVHHLTSICNDPHELENAINIALTSDSQTNARKLFANERVAYRDGTAALHAAEALIALASKAKSINYANFLKPALNTNLENN